VLPEADHVLEAMRATQAALEVNLNLEEHEAVELRQADPMRRGRGAMGAAQGGVARDLVLMRQAADAPRCEGYSVRKARLADGSV
jgi:hypothetical protein